MAPNAVTAVLRIPLHQLQHGPNVRDQLDGIEELAAQLLAFGQEQVIKVIELGPDRYEVFDGNRRLAAARRAKLPHLDAILREPPTPAERVERQLLMGVSGRGLGPIDEARAMEKLMFEHGRTREQIAARFGRSSGWVRDRVALLQLTDREQRDVARGALSLAEANLRLRLRRNGGTAPAVVAAPAAARRKQERHCRTCTCNQTDPKGPDPT
jgi:ParB family chromosome partitioning protein